MALSAVSEDRAVLLECGDASVAAPAVRPARHVSSFILLLVASVVTALLAFASIPSGGHRATGPLHWPLRWRSLVASLADTGNPLPRCSPKWVESCQYTGCCEDSGYACYARDSSWAACRQECNPHQADLLSRTPWTCELVTERSAMKPPDPIPLIGLDEQTDEQHKPLSDEEEDCSPALFAVWLSICVALVSYAVLMFVIWSAKTQQKHRGSGAADAGFLDDPAERCLAVCRDMLPNRENDGI